MPESSLQTVEIAYVVCDFRNQSCEGFPACPGGVRRETEALRVAQVQKRACSGQRLLLEHVKGCAGDDPVVNCEGEGFLVTGYFS